MVGLVMVAGTMNLSEIVERQETFWYILAQPVAFIIFIIASIAEMNRAPFDIPEAEQELVAGYHTEYTGIRFALFFLSEFTSLLSLSALGATVFLGGWQGPFLPGWVWFILKTYVMIFLFMWIRWTFPRVRIDQMMKFNWKYLFPLALINILLTGAGIMVFKHFNLMGG
jgi:NADH-quinone oxidoreductase subunit H